MSAVSILKVPRDVLDSARLTIPELKVELAVYLYAKAACPSARRASWPI